MVTPKHYCLMRVASFVTCVSILHLLSTQPPFSSPKHVLYCCCCSVTKSCQFFCDLVDCSPPGSSVHGTSQARIPEWVATSFYRGIFPTHGSNLHLQCLLLWQANSLPLSHQGVQFSSVTQSCPTLRPHVFLE